VEQIERSVHCRSALAEAGVDSYCVDVQLVRAWQCLSDVEVGATDSNWDRKLHSVIAAQALLEVAVGLAVSYMVGPHTILCPHTRSDVVVGGYDSYWALLHTVLPLQMRSEVRVGATV
jgi:hypothetical protein